MTTGTAKLRRNNKVTPAEWQLLEEEVVRPLSILQVFDAFQVTVAVVWAPKLSMRLLIAPAFSDPESRSIELFQYLLSISVGPISFPPENASAPSSSAKLMAILAPSTAVATNN